MVLLASFLVTAAAVGISASPLDKSSKIATVPLKRINNVTDPKALVAHAQSRLVKANGFAVSSGTVHNQVVSYVAPITVGSSTFDLIIDTGSSNTWVGAQGGYNPGSTAQDTGNSFDVGYGSGDVSGEEYTDKVSFAGLTVKKQSIGSASDASGFENVDGILGVGPVDLTEDTVSNTNTVPTFLDNLYSQGSISQEVLGVYFKPESGSDEDDANGELTLGGVDSSKYTGSINYVPTLKSGSASAYWGISIGAITYGSTTLASSASGIVDTGTTITLISSSAWSKFTSATGGKSDRTGLTSFTTKPTSNLSITIGSVKYTLTPSQYLVPTAQYAAWGLSSGKYYAYVASGGSSGVTTVIGQKFLEYYYSVFDTTNGRVGFATAA